jgi:hypothetical protein
VWSLRDADETLVTGYSANRGTAVQGLAEALVVTDCLPSQMIKRTNRSVEASVLIQHAVDELFIRLAKYLNIPSVVRMNEFVAAFVICELGVDQKAGSYWVRVTQRFWKADTQGLRKLLIGNGTNMISPCSPEPLSR